MFFIRKEGSKKLDKLKNFKPTKLMKTAATFAGVFILTSGAVMGVSAAAFTGWVGQPNNSWTAGTMALVSDKATAQFVANDIVPGYTESHCINITSNSTVASTLQFYASESNIVGNLGDHMNIKVETGSGGTDGASSCTGFTTEQTLFDGSVTALNAANGSVETAANVTKPLAANGTQQFKITATLPGSTPNSAQGTAFNLDFNWVNHS
jgi:hypothetical protein